MAMLADTDDIADNWLAFDEALIHYFYHVPNPFAQHVTKVLSVLC
jgi:hypothetical protein